MGLTLDGMGKEPCTTCVERYFSSASDIRTGSNFAERYALAVCSRGIFVLSAHYILYLQVHVLMDFTRIKVTPQGVRKHL